MKKDLCSEYLKHFTTAQLEYKQCKEKPGQTRVGKWNGAKGPSHSKDPIQEVSFTPWAQDYPLKKNSILEGIDDSWGLVLLH